MGDWDKGHNDRDANTKITDEMFCMQKDISVTRTKISWIKTVLLTLVTAVMLVKSAK